MKEEYISVLDMCFFSASLNMVAALALFRTAYVEYKDEPPLTEEERAYRQNAAEQEDIELAAFEAELDQDSEGLR